MLLLPPEEASSFLSICSLLIGYAASRLGAVAQIVDLKSFRAASNHTDSDWISRSVA